MTPEELQIVIGTLTPAVSTQPVLVEIDGDLREFGIVETTTLPARQRMVLHVAPLEQEGSEG